MLQLLHLAEVAVLLLQINIPVNLFKLSMHGAVE
jgi:hypothetical protein